MAEAPAASPSGETTPPAQPAPTPEPSPAPGSPQPSSPAEPGGDGKKDDGQVPRGRLNEALEAKKTAEAELAKLQKEKEEREQAELSETEKEKKAREKAEEKLAAAEQKALNLERGSWVREAARALNFADAGDAVAMLTLSELDTEDKAKAAVKELSEKKPHLIATGSGPTTFGRTAGEGGGNEGEVPKGADGKPDQKMGMGRDLFQHLTGKRAG